MKKFFASHSLPILPILFVAAGGGVAFLFFCAGLRVDFSVDPRRLDEIVGRIEIFHGVEALLLATMFFCGVLGFLKYRGEVGEAWKASHAKSSFLSHVSHEIRTSMNAIIGMSELAVRDYGKPQGLERVVSINQAGTNLLALINDLLDFSKIESGRMEIAEQPYETARLLNDVLAVLRAPLEDKALDFSVSADESIPAGLVGDAHRVRQVLLNLLSNAVKYTERGFVRFTARWQRRPGDIALLTFTVEDSGIGIRPEEMKKLFVTFSRLDIKRNAAIEGTGLGLSISRSLLRSMDGDISVTSEYGGGSTFTAVVPQKIADDKPMGVLSAKITPRPKACDASFTAPGFRMLIVDDMQSNLMVAEGLLAPYKMKVDTCLSGEKALAMMRENDYGLVLMDHIMPGMDGLETTAAIRALGGRFEKLPVAALTANAVSGMKEMFLARGFDDFLSKPIEIPKLHSLIARWVPDDQKELPQITKNGTKNAAAFTLERHGGKLTATISLMHGMRARAPAAKPDAASFGIEGVDTALGMLLSGGTEARYRSVLDIYCRDVNTRLGFLNSGYARENLKNFVTQVHALKSASGSIGAQELSREAALLESAGKQEDMATIGAGVDRFRVRLAEMTGRIEAALAGSDAEAGSESESDGRVARRDITPLLLLLKKALESEDVRTTDRLLGTFSTMPLDRELSEAVSGVSDRVLAAEFGDAARIVECLVKKDAEQPGQSHK